MRKKILTVSSIVIILSVLATVYIYENVIDISRNFPEIITEHNITKDPTEKKKVFIGVISRYPPAAIYQGYQPLMDYLTAKTEYIFELKLSSTYEETVNQLVNNEVSAAFLGSYVYIKAREKYNVRCILKPLNENNEQFFNSALIIKKESNLTDIKDLVGKKVALPSKHSFSSNWFLYYELPKNNMNIKDLDSIYNFSHHQSVIYQVLKGNFDAGVVREPIAKQFINRGIKIISLSPSVPGSPLVVSHQTNDDIVKAIRDNLLHLDRSLPEIKKMIQTWDPEFASGFVEARDEDYDNIRSIIKKSTAKVDW